MALAALLAGLLAPQPGASAASPLPPDLQNALSQTISGRTDVLAFLIYTPVVDHAELSADGRSALLWLAFEERATGRRVAAEPMLAVASRASLTQPWQISLPADADWAARLAAAPAELISADLRANFLSAAAAAAPASAGPLAISGYKLPWAGGLSKLLEGSIGHVYVYNSCANYWHCWYAYDFADGTMFPLLAVRGGESWVYYDGCANYNPNCSNYLVIRDTSTSPTTYQLYLHLAQGSIPAALKHQGAPIVQGQYIGNVDDTGYSTGHHLHFHVFTYFTSNYWGPSVDITFDDVPVNGGRPRTCYEAANWPDWGTECVAGDWYTSGNWGAFPPQGSLTAPLPGSLVPPAFEVSGAATDDVGITAIQVIGRWDGGWHDLTTPFSSTPFSAPVDLCAAGAPAGPLDLALRLTDYEGNLSRDLPGLRMEFYPATCGTPPDLAILSPGWYIPDQAFTIQAAAAHPAGISGVAFYWLPPASWPDITWQLLGVDTDGSDGYAWTVDPAYVGVLAGGSFFVRATAADGSSRADWRMGLQIDTTPPTSALNALANPYPGSAVQLTWSGSDPETGLDHYELESSLNGGAWQVVSANLPAAQSSAWVQVGLGQSAAFRLRAVDVAGNVEPWDAGVSTQTEAACAPDGYEDGDDASAGAASLLTGQPQAHSLCGQADTDWALLKDVPGGEDILILASSVSGGAAVRLELYTVDDLPLGVISTSPRLGQGAALRWTPPQTGDYLLKVQPLDPALAGSTVIYRLTFGPAFWLALPIVGR